MTPFFPENTTATIRNLTHRDLEAIAQLLAAPTVASDRNDTLIRQMGRWYGLLKILSLFPNPWQYLFCAYVAQQDNQVLGMIQISPFNRTRSTWRVEQVVVDAAASRYVIGSQLLRHCLQAVREARTWLLEVDVTHTDAIALYRQNGFQPLAQMTYWELPPAILAALASREPALPNLLPVSNADAQPLYQLDTVAMPPLVRQVFDRHIDDFKTSLLTSFIQALQQWIGHTEVVSGYVFETQRQAAIGYFQLRVAADGQCPHVADLTVHPAYTWLYPELMSQMARITQDFPNQSLQLTSVDYQPEREEYLERLGASRIKHTLLMSRSVWHKLRESKLAVSLENLQLIQGLQPAKPVPLGQRSWSSVRQLSADADPDLFKEEATNNGFYGYSDFPQLPEEQQ
ncbi:MAG: GNAT family N-acetyltransferase [Hormoscilla sp. GUM202]|nr:GNAT family N-acetyltransferase [Hormoscilla sp. GUM202]